MVKELVLRFVCIVGVILLITALALYSFGFPYLEEFDSVRSEYLVGVPTAGDVLYTSFALSEVGTYTFDFGNHITRIRLSFSDSTYAFSANRAPASFSIAFVDGVYEFSYKNITRISTSAPVFAIISGSNVVASYSGPDIPFERHVRVRNSTLAFNSTSFLRYIESAPDVYSWVSKWLSDFRAMYRHVLTGVQFNDGFIATSLRYVLQFFADLIYVPLSISGLLLTGILQVLIYVAWVVAVPLGLPLMG